MKEIPFSTILAALTDPAHNFPSRYLPRFSDIHSADLEAFLKAWSKLPTLRKRVFLKKLNELFEEDNVVSFENMAFSLLKDEDGEVRTLALKLMDETYNARFIPYLIKILGEDP